MAKLEKISETRTVDYTGVKVYCGIDVHKKNWNVTIYVENVYFKTFQQPPNPESLMSFLSSKFPNGNYYCCYESGFSGFWIQRNFEKLGVNCIVVNPADIPKTHKDLVSKTDSRDSRALADALSNNQLTPVYIIGVDDEADRSLVRYRKSIQQDLTRRRNKVKSLLFLLGIEIPETYAKSVWTNNFIKWLEELKIEQASLKNTLTYMLEDVKINRQKLLTVNKELKLMSKHEKYNDLFSLLIKVPGIGLIVGMTLLTEIVDIKRFSSFRKFNSYVGLCPSSHSSGEKDYKGRMIKRANHRIRELIIESAWVAIRNDTALTKKYAELTKRQSSKRAIITIAQKLLSRIYYVLKNKEIYQTGITK
jgi:transposase